MCMRKLRDCERAKRVRDGFLMLKVIIGDGVRVSVVKEERVMPL